LTEIKVVATSIVIVLADWNAFKEKLIKNAPAMLKIHAFDGSPKGPSS
jgi:hypothetical protein